MQQGTQNQTALISQLIEITLLQDPKTNPFKVELKFEFSSFFV